jgi:hypothetical protein
MVCLLAWELPEPFREKGSDRYLTKKGGKATGKGKKVRIERREIKEEQVR